MKKFLVILLLLSGCGGGSTPSNPYPGRLDPTAGQWADFGTDTGAGFVGRLSNPFTIPASPVSVNYVYTQPSGPLSSKTLTLNYSVTGDATFATVDGGNPTIRLFIWQTNDTGGNTYRWWCDAGAALVLGNNQTLSCTVSPDVAWSDVNGIQASTQTTAFTTAINNPFAVGFTFGGTFAGHGVWTTSGNATFIVNSFTIRVAIVHKLIAEIIAFACVGSLAVPITVLTLARFGYF